MPNCFQLRKKGEKDPEVLVKVDEAICEYFGVEVDPKYWVANWYNVIGFLIAIGKGELGSEGLRTAVREWYDSYPDPVEGAERRETMGKILAFLEERYESSWWVEIGRR